MVRAPLLTVLLLLLVLPVAHGAVAQASDERAQVDEAWSRELRTLELDVQRRGFVMRSGDLENGTDVQTVRFDTDTATLRWSLRETTPTEDEADDTDPPVSNATLRFDGIMEYEDVDGDGRLGIVDSVAKNVRFRDMMFPRITSREPAPGQEEVVVRYTFPDAQRGTVHLRFLFTSDVAHLGNDTLLPSHTRLDILIDRYMYRQSNGTNLALDARLQQDPLLRGNAMRPQAVDDHQPHFVWNRSADADGERVDVGLTVARYESGPDAPAVIVFSYPRGHSLVHSAQIGFEKTIAEETTLISLGGKIIGEWRVFTLGLLLAAIVVGAAAYPRIRSRL